MKKLKTHKATTYSSRGKIGKLRYSVEHNFQQILAYLTGTLLAFISTLQGIGGFSGDEEAVVKGFGFKFVAHSLLILDETTYYGSCYFVSYMHVDICAPWMWSTEKGVEVVGGYWKR